jgi:hypothetical protein
MHRREMNRTEVKYAEYLRERLMVGEIRWWAFEAWKFRLADSTYYTPDFIIVTNDLRVEAHEVKAQWSTGKPGWQEDARVKIKCAAEQHPVRFVAVTLNKDQSWAAEYFGLDREEPSPPTDLELLGQALGMAMVPRDVSDVIRAIHKLREVPHV